MNRGFEPDQIRKETHKWTKIGGVMIGLQYTYRHTLGLTNQMKLRLLQRPKADVKCLIFIQQNW